METTLTVNRDYRNNGPAPLYNRYPNQMHPQSAHLELTEDGEVRVDYNGEIGNAIPADVFYERTLRWDIPENLSIEGIDSLLEKALPLLEQIQDHRTIVNNGANLIGLMDTTARACDNELENMIESYRYELMHLAAPFEMEEFCAGPNGVDDIIKEYRNAEDKDQYFEALVKEANHELKFSDFGAAFLDPQSIQDFRKELDRWATEAAAEDLEEEEQQPEQS